jgi:hypothetical protein
MTFWSHTLVSKTEPPNPHNPKDKANATTGRDLTPVRVIVDSFPPSPPLSEEEKAKKHRQERREKVKFVAELIIGFFVVVYTIASIALWFTARHANEIANQSVVNADINFRRDERAWMAFKFMEGSLTFTLDKSFLVPTELVNVGKTPAKNVHGSIVVGVFKRGEPLDFAYSPGHASYKVMAGTIFPNGKIAESFEAIKHGQDRAEAIVFTRPLKDELFSGQSFIVVHGRIEYGDIFGTTHWTTYCRFVLHPELISEECTRYNDTDNNN